MMEWFRAADISLLHLINGEWVSPVADKVMPILSTFRTMKWFLGLILLAMVIWGKRRARIFILLAVVLLLVGDTGIAYSLKRLGNRPRPFQGLSSVRHVSLDGVTVPAPDPVEHGNSFPSAHTMNNTAGAMLVSWMYPQWAIVAWLWVGLLGYSRIYTDARDRYIVQGTGTECIDYIQIDQSGRVQRRIER